MPNFYVDQVHTFAQNSGSKYKPHACLIRSRICPPFPVKDAGICTMGSGSSPPKPGCEDPYGSDDLAQRFPEVMGHTWALKSLPYHLSTTPLQRSVEPTVIFLDRSRIPRCDRLAAVKDFFWRHGHWTSTRSLLQGQFSHRSAFL